jgi:hypothetical protein
LNPYSVAGTGFSLTGAPTPPYTLAPGNFLDLTVRFSGNIAAAYSASLQVNTINVILLATAVPGALLTVFPYFCLFVAAQTISDYIAYRDIFHAGEVSEAATS